MASRADRDRAGSSGRPHLVALEEHLIPPSDEHAALWRSTVPMIPESSAAPMRAALEDVGERRLGVMSAAGISRAVLSNVASVQPVSDAGRATRLAAEANEHMARVVATDPDRYGGFATVALQDPRRAAEELERSVSVLGLKGAMTFGVTNGTYLDDRSYDVFWAAVEALGVPLFLHAASPPTPPASLAGRPELDGAVWGWTVETATHFLRLLFGGVFDRFPGAKVMLGHMGETVPYLSARLDSRAKASQWDGAHEPSYYLRNNLLVTTSGVFADEPLRCAIDTIGIGNVFFALDYPFESGAEARLWFDRAAITHDEAEAIAWKNASALLYTAAEVE